VLESFLSDTLALPGYLSVASAILLVVHLTLSSNAFKRLQSRVFRRPPFFDLDNSPDSRPDINADNVSAEFRAHVAHHGGAVIFSYKVARLVGCLALLGFSIYSFALDIDVVSSQGIGSGGKWGKNHKRKKQQGYNLSVKEWLELSMCMNYVCSTHFKCVLWI
jgi:hypothetical protein